MSIFELNKKTNKNKYLMAQGVVEYMMVFVFAAILMYGIAMMFDLKSLKNFAIYGILDKTNKSKIIIPPMTD